MTLLAHVSHFNLRSSPPSLDFIGGKAISHLRVNLTVAMDVVILYIVYPTHNPPYHLPLDTVTIPPLNEPSFYSAIAEIAIKPKKLSRLHSLSFFVRCKMT